MTSMLDLGAHMNFFQTEESRKWYNQALKLHDDNGIRIKLAVMTPPVYESRDEMVQSWKGVLTALKKLLARPNIDVHGDSYVSK